MVIASMIGFGLTPQFRRVDLVLLFLVLEEPTIMIPLCVMLNVAGFVILRTPERSSWAIRILWRRIFLLGILLFYLGLAAFTIVNHSGLWQARPIFGLLCLTGVCLALIAMSRGERARIFQVN
jgi:hypothetical protein